MLIEIVRFTPSWVWGLLAALLLLGLWQTRPRTVARAQLLALPLALLALGLWSMRAGFVVQPSALVLWLVALGALLALGQRLPRPPGARWQSDTARLQLPGSWLPMAMIVGIFTLRYAISVAQALHPAWRSAPEVLLPVAALYGAMAGLLLGRALGLLRLTLAPHATITGHAIHSPH
jgi:hypothetical protein